MDKHIPNEKELIRPRRLCLRREIPEPGTQNFACGANYLAARWFNSACGANYPHQALKGGYFVFVWRAARCCVSLGNVESFLGSSYALANLI